MGAELATTPDPFLTLNPPAMPPADMESELEPSLLDSVSPGEAPPWARWKCPVAPAAAAAGAALRVGRGCLPEERSANLVEGTVGTPNEADAVTGAP
jgi:hypothetical protein